MTDLTRAEEITLSEDQEKLTQSQLGQMAILLHDTTCRLPHHRVPRKDESLPEPEYCAWEEEAARRAETWGLDTHKRFLDKAGRALAAAKK